jgi:hypothetical protein
MSQYRVFTSKALHVFHALVHKQAEDVELCRGYQKERRTTIVPLGSWWTHLHMCLFIPWWRVPRGWVYGRRLIFVFERTNKRHHHHDPVLQKFQNPSDDTSILGGMKSWVLTTWAPLTMEESLWNHFHFFKEGGRVPRHHENGYPPLVTIYTNDQHESHIPILLQYCGSYSYVRHDPYLPSISASLQSLDRVEYATIHVVAPSVSRIDTPLSLTLFSHRLLEVQKFDSEHFHQSSHHY